MGQCLGLSKENIEENRVFPVKERIIENTTNKSECVPIINVQLRQCDNKLLDKNKNFELKIDHISYTFSHKK